MVLVGGDLNSNPRLGILKLKLETSPSARIVPTCILMVQETFLVRKPQTTGMNDKNRCPLHFTVTSRSPNLPAQPRRTAEGHSLVVEN